MTSTWKILGLGAVAVGILVFANAEVQSYGRQAAITKMTIKHEQPVGFVTNTIYGSDSATSTWGLDPQRTVDW